MSKDKITTTPDGQQPAQQYDNNYNPGDNLPQDIIPDEVPRKDGPGGKGQ